MKTKLWLLMESFTLFNFLSAQMLQLHLKYGRSGMTTKSPPKITYLRKFRSFYRFHFYVHSLVLTFWNQSLVLFFWLLLPLLRNVCQRAVTLPVSVTPWISPVSLGFLQVKCLWCLWMCFLYFTHLCYVICCQFQAKIFAVLCLIDAVLLHHYIP